MIVSARQERKPLGRFGLVGCATAISLGVIASFGIAEAQTSYEVLHDFTGGPTDGENPSAGVIGATDGNLYGTTYWGGAGDVGLICDGIGCGTVFEITAEDAVTIVHAFAGSDTTGAPHPDGGLVQGTDGFLYGTTILGGGSGCEGIGCGTVFRVATDGSGYAILHTFMGVPTDGGAHRRSQPEWRPDPGDGRIPLRHNRVRRRFHMRRIRRMRHHFPDGD
jgi:uncharacterized repeat protein (TIGR03803 family)